MAPRAGDLRMLPNQRVFRLCVIEIKTRKHGLPPTRRVAGIAGFLELALVRVRVAGGASSKPHVLIPRGPAWRVRLVAFFTSHLAVQPCQWITCLRMIEILRGFPTIHGV